LVEALGHCAECPTPLNALGALDKTRWMQGAANPSSNGLIPAISPDRLDSAVEDLAEYLSSSFTLGFDVAGSHMAAVVENTS